MADGALYTPDYPESAQFPELAQLLGRRAAGDADLVVRARSDPNTYVEACGRIEGQVWVGKQAGAHRMWQDHFTRSGSRLGSTTSILLAAVGHAKSTQVHRWRTTWELGKNPNLRVLQIGRASCRERVCAQV